jgi:hypothetical protein
VQHAKAALEIFEQLEVEEDLAEWKKGVVAYAKRVLEKASNTSWKSAGLVQVFNGC